MDATVPKVMSRHHALDRLGAAGSLLCAVHFALMPLLLVMAPAVGAGLDSPAFDRGFVAFASLIGALSLGRGYRKHGDRRACLLLAAGCGLLWPAVLLPGMEGNRLMHTLAMVAGGAFVACAHGLNLRLTRHRHVACA